MVLVLHCLRQRSGNWDEGEHGFGKMCKHCTGLDWFWPKWWESDWAADKSLFINILYIAATTTVVISSPGPLLSQKYSERWRNIRLGSREAIQWGHCVFCQTCGISTTPTPLFLKESGALWQVFKKKNFYKRAFLTLENKCFNKEYNQNWTMHGILRELLEEDKARVIQ